MKTYYAIKRPTASSGRGTFAVIVTTVRADGVRKNTTADDPRIDAANAAYRAGHQDQEKTFLQIKEIVQAMRREAGVAKPRPVFSQENIDLVLKYWADVKEHRPLQDPDSMKRDFLRAARACGIVPIASASKEQLQKAVNVACMEPTKPKPTMNAAKQRRVVLHLNAVLTWLGRGFKLDRAKKPKPNIKYLTLEELADVSKHLKNDLARTLMWTLFGTGCRFGEVFAISDETFHRERRIVHVTGQRWDDWSLHDTKNRTNPEAPIVPEAFEWVEKWMAIPEETKRSMRAWKARDHLTAACRKAFPGRPEKHIHWHQLRHSYAKHLLRRGFHIEDVAAAIGDYVHTAQEYYGGKTFTQERADWVASRLWGK